MNAAICTCAISADQGLLTHDANPSDRLWQVLHGFVDCVYDIREFTSGQCYPGHALTISARQRCFPSHLPLGSSM
jgi:hypothetical protein